MAVEARLDAWLAVLHELGGSDILLTDGSRPRVRVAGQLRVLEAADPLSGEEIEAIVRTQIDDQYGDRVHLGREVEFAFTWRNQSRIRAAAFYQRGSCSLSLRRAPLEIPTMEELGLPPELRGPLSERSGLILVTGQAGCGKSTSIAAMVEEINRTEAYHIITIEDPIEFYFANREATVSQREVGTDSRSFVTALRTVRREDPDVVVVSEVRDPETIAAVLDIAEAGHMVIAALPINYAASCIDRLIDVFPMDRRDQVRVQVAGTLRAVLYQRLVRRRGGGLVAAHELLLGTPAVRRLIRGGSTQRLREMLVTEGGAGMRTLERSLTDLIEAGVIDREAALDATLYPQDIDTPGALVLPS